MILLEVFPKKNKSYKFSEKFGSLVQNVFVTLLDLHIPEDQIDLFIIPLCIFRALQVELKNKKLSFNEAVNENLRK